MSFRKDLDYALEEILRKCSLRVSEESHLAFYLIEASILSKWMFINGINSNSRTILDNLFVTFNDILINLSWRATAHIEKMNRLTRSLSYLGGFEDAARKSGKGIIAKNPDIRMDRDLINAKIRVSLDKFYSKLTLEMNRAYIAGEDFKQARQRFLSLIPKKVRRKKRVLPRNFTEAKKEKIPKAAIRAITDRDWLEIVSEYKDEYIPMYRYWGPEILGGSTYGWEIENEVTSEFVNQVKDGTIDSANDAGINDFMWVAVLDEKTRESHRQRDGLTTQEIQERLDSGEIVDESETEGDPTVAPHGFNCRCRSVPFVQELDDNFKKYGDFESWIL